MKNKILFILPRVLLITFVIGAIGMILMTLFKILILGSIVCSIALLIFSRWRKKDLQRENQQEHWHPQGSFQYSTKFVERALPIRPMVENKLHAKPSIIPIY